MRYTISPLVIAREQANAASTLRDALALARDKYGADLPKSAQMATTKALALGGGVCALRSDNGPLVLASTQQGYALASLGVFAQASPIARVETQEDAYSVVESVNGNLPATGYQSLSQALALGGGFALVRTGGPVPLLVTREKTTDQVRKYKIDMYLIKVFIHQNADELYKSETKIVNNLEEAAFEMALFVNKHAGVWAECLSQEQYLKRRRSILMAINNAARNGRELTRVNYPSVTRGESYFTGARAGDRWRAALDIFVEPPQEVNPTAPADPGRKYRFRD